MKYNATFTRRKQGAGRVLRRTVICFSMVVLLFFARPLSEAQNALRMWLDSQERWQDVSVPEESTKPGRKRFAVVSIYSKNEYGDQMKALTYHNKKEYCEKHGYDLIDAMDSDELLALHRNLTKGDDGEHITHGFKFEALKYYLPKYDWIMWSDADSVFLNFTKTLEGIVDEDFDVLLTASPDDGAKWAKIVNTGHFFVKSSDWTEAFLSLASEMSVSDCRNYLHEVDTPNHSTVLNGWLEICDRKDGSFWDSDQGVIQWLLSFKDPLFRCHFKHHVFREFNSEYPWYGDGDLVLHFPGRPMVWREKLIRLIQNYTDFHGGGVIDRSKTKDLKWRRRTDSSHFGGAYERDEYERLYAPMNRKCT